MICYLCLKKELGGGGGGGGGMCQAIFRYGWVMCKKLPVGNFKWLDNEDISKFNDELIKNMMKIVIWDIFLK